MPRLILASGSPRRSMLLNELGVEFEVRPVEIDESLRAGESPQDLVVRLAREKATAKRTPNSLILAADTMVVLDGEALGKPDDVDAVKCWTETRTPGTKCSIWPMPGWQRTRVRAVFRSLGH